MIIKSIKTEVNIKWYNSKFVLQLNVKYAVFYKKIFYFMLYYILNIEISLQVFFILDKKERQDIHKNSCLLYNLYVMLG